MVNLFLQQFAVGITHQVTHQVTHQALLAEKDQKGVKLEVLYVELLNVLVDCPRHEPGKMIVESACWTS